MKYKISEIFILITLYLYKFNLGQIEEYLFWFVNSLHATFTTVTHQTSLVVTSISPKLKEQIFVIFLWKKPQTVLGVKAILPTQRSLSLPILKQKETWYLVLYPSVQRKRALIEPRRESSLFCTEKDHKTRKDQMDSLEPLLEPSTWFFMATEVVIRAIAESTHLITKFQMKLWHSAPTP